MKADELIQTKVELMEVEREKLGADDDKFESWSNNLK
jgi:hypothetical protein